jgi:hypothetical protein
MTEVLAQNPTGILAVTFLFGGGAVYLIIDSVASHWRRAVTAQAEIGLKKALVEQGYPADEIVRVVAAGRSDRPRHCASESSAPTQPAT